MNTDAPHRSIALTPPKKNKQGVLNASQWVDWFWSSFLPAWIVRARDPQGFGFFDRLNENAAPIHDNRRTILSQARLLFTFSHLALVSDNPIFREAAVVAYDALKLFHNNQGGYYRALTTSAELNGNTDDALAYSYDQCFVILSLSTWARVDAKAATTVASSLEECWSYIENSLTDSETGLLLEHDGLEDPAHNAAPVRAQNPHMHLYEAALQAYEMSANPVWLERAMRMRAKGLDYFYDKDTGTIFEFLTPNLATQIDREGQRREIGHQCEWAWLLYRECELGGDLSVKRIANKLLAFADQHGFSNSGALQSAAFDAVSCDASWRENQFLLWPQTEAIKTYAIRAANPGHKQKAQDLTTLVFRQYFENHAAFVNQLDNNGLPVWPEALSRLMYHLVLALTEGARAGLWSMPE